MSAAIELEHVSFHYEGARVLEDVNMCLEEGHVGCLIGPNGGGKSTLLRLILGLLQPASGRIHVLGMKPKEGRSRIGYVPQDFDFDAQFPIRVRDVVAMGCLHLPFLRRWREARGRVGEALESVGMAGTERRWFSRMSGGERQRVLIARALASRPKLLLLDEPTSSVDVAAESGILDMLEDFRGEMTMLVVSHSAEVASRFLQDIYCVKGTVHKHPPTDKLDAELMRHLVGLDIGRKKAN